MRTSDKKVLWGFLAVVAVAFFLVYASDVELWLNVTAKLLIRAVVWVVAAFFGGLLLFGLWALVYLGFRRIFPKKDLPVIEE